MDSNTVAHDEQPRMPSQLVLSGRRAQVMAAIVAHCMEHGGSPPTYHEIAERTGITAKSHVHYCLRQLAAAGMVTMPYRRSIEIPGATWAPPERLLRQMAAAGIEVAA